MNHDIDVKKVRLNCFRQSKVPGEFMLQMRVPGGMVDAKYLSLVECLPKTWGDGNFHFGTRQSFEIPGIKYEDLPAVNAYLESYIKEVDGELCDFGVIGLAHMTYHPDRCLGCGACVRACQDRASRVLKLNEDSGKIEKDTCRCVGCGECVRACPTGGWTRDATKFYRVILGGRTGRQTPRTGKMFLNRATEDVVLAVLCNWQKLSAWAINYKPEYLHGGHLIDRASYKKFKELILEGVELNPECLVAEDIYWHETEYRSNFNVKPLEMHHTAGPQG